MQLATKSRYAIRILFELGKTEKPFAIPSISERTGIALRTIETITAVLRQNNITTSVLGVNGGIILARPLAEITLGDIVMLFENGVQFAVCCGDKSNDCPNQWTCENKNSWKKISQRIQTELDRIPIQEIFTHATFLHTK